jgi:hypothetical protein
MPDDKVPDPWAKPSPYHKQELDNLGALHKALAAHIQFQERLERGRAYLQPFRIAAAQRPDGRLQSRHTVVAVEPASVQRERARVVVWLLQAFGPIWDEAQTALDLPPHYVAGALEVALHGGWGDWDAPPPARREGESVRPRDAALSRISCFVVASDAQSSTETWKAWSGCVFRYALSSLLS